MAGTIYSVSHAFIYESVNEYNYRGKKGPVPFTMVMSELSTF